MSLQDDCVAVDVGATRRFDPGAMTSLTPEPAQESLARSAFQPEEAICLPRRPRDAAPPCPVIVASTLPPKPGHPFRRRRRAPRPATRPRSAAERSVSKPSSSGKVSDAGAGPLRGFSVNSWMVSACAPRASRAALLLPGSVACLRVIREGLFISLIRSSVTRPVTGPQVLAVADDVHKAFRVSAPQSPTPTIHHQKCQQDQNRTESPSGFMLLLLRVLSAPRPTYTTVPGESQLAPVKAPPLP